MNIQKVNEANIDRASHSSPLDRLITPSSNMTPVLGSLAEVQNNRETGISRSLDRVGDIQAMQEYGITPNLVDENLPAQLAEEQSALKKLGNSLAQAVISETILGTGKGLSDLVDFVSSKIFGVTDDNYSNPVSQYLGKLQEDFKEFAPIYTNPDTNIFNGGLTDSGWWTSNLPSVMSSLTLLIPSTGVVKGLSWAGKGLNALSKGRLANFTSKGYKVITGAGKAKTIEEAEKLNKVTKWLNDTNTIAAGQRMAETGVNAALMRTMENYQEAHQVYEDMREKALDNFNSMSNEEYTAFVAKNADKLQDVDINDKEAVANKLAKDSADTTFMFDYLNTVFDVIQLNALRNPIKLLRNMRASASIQRAQRESMRAIGRAAGASETAAEQAGVATTIKNFGKNVGGFIKDSGYTIKAELSEGVEEAINYIAQEEGMHYGNVALGEDIDNNFTSRLNSYMRSPELYDSAFWGVMGGVIFQGLGSGFNRLQTAAERSYQKKKNKENEKTGEKTNKESFQELFETAEHKRRVADINARTEDFNNLVGKLNQIENQKIDPFNNDENGNPLTLETETERTVAKERAISEYITNMTFRAMDNGNFDMLKAYLQDANIRQALEKATGNEGDGGAFINSLVNRMDHIANRYNQNLIALSNISRNVNISNSNVVPIEYLQIIARDNTYNQIELENINARINTYETSAANKTAVYGDKLDKALNYKDAVQLVVLTQQLAQLRKQRSELEKSKDKQGIGRAIELDRINKKIQIVEDMITGQGTLSNSDALTRLIYSTIEADTINDKTSRAKNLDALMSGDITSIIGENNAKKFKTTDEELIKIFGEDKTSGAYKVLASDINAVFEGAYGLNKIDQTIGDDYVALAALNIEKAVLNEDIIMNEANLKKRVNELHNDMNDARRKAIDKARQSILKLAKKYGRDKITEHLEKNTPIAWENNSDKREYDDALEILNLTSASNQQLYDNIQFAIMKDGFIEASQEAAKPKEEKNTVSEKPKSEEEKSKIDSKSAKENKTKVEAEKPLNDEEKSKSEQEKSKKENTTPIIPKGATPLIKSYKVAEQEVASMTWNEGGATFYNANGTHIGGSSMTAEEFERLTGVKPATISSTGGQESKPSPKVDEFGNPIADTNRMAIEDEITKELSTAAKNAINNKSDVIAAINTKIQELGAKYGSDEGYKKHINRMANFIAKKASKKDLTVDVANVAILASSVTEQGGKYHFPEEFLKAAEKFAENFLSAVNAKEYNGKKVVSFESMLRFANEQMEDNTTADYIYKALKAWFQNGPDANKYIILDNMDSTSILQRAAMTNKELAQQRLGGTNVFRVDIYSALNHMPSKRAIDALQVGDTLTAEFNNAGDIILLSNGVEIGRLPQPEIDSSTGAFKKTNNGWITDVRLANGKVFSELRKVWEDILLVNDPIHNKINTYIYQIIAARKINGDTAAINTAIENDADIKQFFDNLKTRNLVDKKANSVELIDGLVSIWNYIDLTNPVQSEREADIQYSLDLWFDKLYDTYSTIANGTTVGLDKLSFKVAKITDGDVIQVAANDNESYDKCTLGNGNEAFANIDTTEIGVIKPGSAGVIQTTANHQVPQPNGSTGSMWAVLPNRSGIPGIVRGHALRFMDTDSAVNNTAAGRIRQAIANEFERRIKEFVADEMNEKQTFESLVQFIDLVLGNNTSTPLLAPVKGGKFNVKKYGDERIVIGWQNNDGSFSNFTINLTNRQYNTEKLGYKDVDNTESFIRDFKSTVLANAMFNVDFRFLDSDSGAATISGLASRDKDGNFVITIPNGTDNPTVESFPSFKHFLMQGGAARWNAKNNGGTNFQPRSNNQLRNQILNVSIELATSLPVERNGDNQITPESVSNNMAIDTILEKKFGKDSPAVKRLQKAGLIPSSVTYTTSTLDKGGHPSNIWTSLGKKTIYVNDEFIKMMNDNPDMAIRKLIHEQLHLKLHGKGNQRKELLNRIGEIITDFRDALDNDTNADQHLREYLFEHIENNEERLEEFLVESLTNRELASYLNSVQTEIPGTKTKKSLLNKILDLLAEIFDWGVTKGSLYEKELKVLQGYTSAEINEISKHNPYNEDITLGDITMDFDSADANGAGAMIPIKKGDKVIGSIALNAYYRAKDKFEPWGKDKDKYVSMSSVGDAVEIDSDQRGKGYGKAAYFEMAKLAAKQSLTLTSAPDGSRTEAATRVWESLVRDGFASKVGDRYEFFNENLIEYLEDESDTGEEIIEEVVEDIFEDEFDEDDVVASSVREVSTSPIISAEMQSIKERAIADGTFMKAPNGKDTNLTERQWLQVRTKNFINWFGDWENDPVNASKVVDENGEPRVCYRGVNDANRNKTYAYFSDSIVDARAYAEGLLTKGGAFFANNKGTIFAINSYLEDRFGIISTDLDYIETLIDDYLHNGEEYEVTDYEEYEDENEFLPFTETKRRPVGTHKEIYKSKVTKEQYEQAAKAYNVIRNDDEAKELLNIIDLIKGTTLRTENDLSRLYDDPDYHKDIKKLNELLDKYNTKLSPYISNYTPDIVKAFLNIKNPYTEEQNSEDLLDNNKAYKDGHDGAFLLKGEHFLVKQGNQIRQINDDTRASSVQETTAPSVNQFVESLPLEERVNFDKLLLDGTVSMKCS